MNKKKLTTEELAEKKALKREKSKKHKTAKRVTLTILSLFLLTIIFNVLLLPLSSENPRVDEVKTYNGNNPFIVFDKHQQVAAHRSGANIAPEETMLAFKTSAVENGVDIVEFDLHMTKDGYVVLLHDHELDRTSNAVSVLGKEGLKVVDCTLSELQKLNFAVNFADKDGKYPYRHITDPTEIKEKGIGIALLDDVLSYLHENASPNLHYIIEVKDKGENGKKITDYLVSEMKKYNIVNKTVLGTFKDDITKYIDEKYPNLSRSASIMEVVNVYFSFLYGTKPHINCNVLQIPTGYAMINLGTKAFVDYCHYYGLAVQYWTINDKATAERLLSYGADAIITDEPIMVKEILSK